MTSLDTISPPPPPPAAPPSFDTMSLMRAFTTRRNKRDLQVIPSPTLGRAASQRAGKPVSRSQISSPVALLSSTNVLSYEAPNLPGTFPIESMSSASSVSGEDSDTSTLSHESHESRDTVTDASSVDMSPISSEPEENHLSCYFKPAVNTQAPSRSPSTASRATFDAPLVPKRVPSHSKKAHESAHRKRSIQRILSPPSSIHTSETTFSPSLPAFVEAPTETPFGSELAQLDEVAEELGQVVRDVEADEDACFMQAHGLASFAASEYMLEIQDLIYSTFTADNAAWL